MLPNFITFILILLLSLPSFSFSSDPSVSCQGNDNSPWAQARAAAESDVRQFLSFFQGSRRNTELYDASDLFHQKQEEEIEPLVEEDADIAKDEPSLLQLGLERCACVYDVVRSVRPKSVAQLADELRYPACAAWALAALRDNEDVHAAHLFTLTSSELAANRTRRVPTSPVASGGLNLVRRVDPSLVSSLPTSSAREWRNPELLDDSNRLLFFWHPIWVQREEEDLFSLLAYAGRSYDLIIVDEPDSSPLFRSKALRQYLTAPHSVPINRYSEMKLLLLGSDKGGQSDVLERAVEYVLPISANNADEDLSLPSYDRIPLFQCHLLLELEWRERRSLLGHAPRPLSYVVSYYGQSQDLIRLIELFQSYPSKIKESITLVIIDDGIADESLHAARVLEESGVDHGSVEVIIFRIDHDLAWNVGGARNLGSYVAPSPWLVHTDMDISFRPTNLVQGLGFLLRQALNDNVVRGHFKMPFRHGENTGSSHAGTMFAWRDFYWEQGACDEDFVGSYGQTDIHFDYRAGPRHVSTRNDVELFEPAENNTARLDQVQGLGRKSYKINERRLKRKKARDQWSYHVLRFPWHLAKILKPKTTIKK